MKQMACDVESMCDDNIVCHGDVSSMYIGVEIVCGNGMMCGKVTVVCLCVVR